VNLGVEDGDADAVGGEGVGVGVRDPFDETVEAQPAKVVGHLVGGVVVAEESGNEPAKAFVGEAGDGVGYDAECAAQGHGACVPEAERSASLALGEWLVETIKDVVPDGTALCGTFLF
jgi:hypothetical protein